MSGNAGLVTFTFNSKKQITDIMENAIYHRFFLISKENANTYRVIVETV